MDCELPSFKWKILSDGGASAMSRIGFKKKKIVKHIKQVLGIGLTLALFRFL